MAEMNSVISPVLIPLCLCSWLDFKANDGLFSPPSCRTRNKFLSRDFFFFFIGRSEKAKQSNVGNVERAALFFCFLLFSGLEISFIMCTIKKGV